MNHFKRQKQSAKEPRKEIELNLDTIELLPSYQKLKEEKKIIADANGRFRYPHGAPVGKLVLTKTKEDGTPIYRELADEWFDPESPKAREFVWPKTKS